MNIVVEINLHADVSGVGWLSIKPEEAGFFKVLQIKSNTGQ
jgi:hypothetical protein